MSGRSREVIVDAVLGMLREGATVSLESAAREVGMTKPGLMYHFPTKQALMLASVDAVANAWWGELQDQLPVAFESASARDRVAAYLEVCIARPTDAADLVMLADPRLRRELTDRWVQLMDRWFFSVDSAPVADRGVLSAVRFMADGVWFAKASGIHSPDSQEAAVILASGYELLSKVHV